jgi:hypothetical protein
MDYIRTRTFDNTYVRCYGNMRYTRTFVRKMRSLHALRKYGTCSHRKYAQSFLLTRVAAVCLHAWIRCIRQLRMGQPGRECGYAIACRTYQLWILRYVWITIPMHYTHLHAIRSCIRKQVHYVMQWNTPIVQNYTWDMRACVYTYTIRYINYKRAAWTWDVRYVRRGVPHKFYGELPEYIQLSGCVDVYLRAYVL